MFFQHLPTYFMSQHFILFYILYLVVLGQHHGLLHPTIINGLNLTQVLSNLIPYLFSDHSLVGFFVFHLCLLSNCLATFLSFFVMHLIFMPLCFLIIPCNCTPLIKTWQILLYILLFYIYSLSVMFVMFVCKTYFSLFCMFYFHLIRTQNVVNYTRNSSSTNLMNFLPLRLVQFNFFYLISIVLHLFELFLPFFFF